MANSSFAFLELSGIFFSNTFDLRFVESANQDSQMWRAAYISNLGKIK